MQKGIYVLVIRLERRVNLRIGALGEITFEKGMYAYVGSAQRNLVQRVNRHLRREKLVFWHIDYLLCTDAAKVERVLYIKGDKAEECAVAGEIGKSGEAIVGFGCSDRRCLSHLFLVEESYFLQACC